MAKGWSIPPSAFADQIDEEVSKRVRTIALALLKEVIERSPVGSPELWKTPPPPGYVGGRFRGSHIVSIGAPVYTATTHVDPSGSDTMSKGMAALSGLEPYTKVFIQTNLPYAERIENGHSTQAAQGVYELAFISVSEAYK
ncbi:HK97 gp10 family phage protein [Pseudomonas chlororaphis]